MMSCKYRPTEIDKQMLERYKKGISIGFTGIASLKSKGLIPRSSGKYILGKKYSCKKREKAKAKSKKTSKAKNLYNL
jgi:hypothetical protein